MIATLSPIWKPRHTYALGFTTYHVHLMRIYLNISTPVLKTSTLGWQLVIIQHNSVSSMQFQRVSTEFISRNNNYPNIHSLNIPSILNLWALRFLTQKILIHIYLHIKMCQLFSKLVPWKLESFFKVIFPPFYK